MASFYRWFNSSGGGITLTKTSTGKFRVTFADQGNFPRAGHGNIHVTSAQPDGYSCNVTAFGAAGPDFVSDVSCFDHGGAPIDNYFFISLDLPYSADAGENAFAFNADGTASSPLSFSNWFNSASDLVSIKRTAVGTYTASFTGLNNGASPQGNFMLTGSNLTGELCRVESWTSPGGGGTAPTAAISCYSQSGVSSDGKFTLSSLWPETSPNRAYGYATIPLTMTATTGDLTISPAAYNSMGGSIGFSRGSAAGIYTVTFGKLGGYGIQQGNVQVTPTGKTAGKCSVSGWNTTASDFIASVKCFTMAGISTDLGFSVEVKGQLAGGQTCGGSGGCPVATTCGLGGQCRPL